MGVAVEYRSSMSAAEEQENTTRVVEDVEKKTISGEQAYSDYIKISSLTHPHDVTSTRMPTTTPTLI